MIRTKVVFSDIDDTLIHKSEDENGSVYIPFAEQFISNCTKSKIVELMSSGVSFALVSGRTYGEYLKIKDFIPHTLAMVEEGTLFVEDGEISEFSMDLLARNISEGGLLWKFGVFLENKGYDALVEDRRASLRVLKNGQILNDSEKEIIKEFTRTEKQFDVDYVINEENIIIVPRLGGKGNAVKHFLKLKGISFDDAISLGNGINDVDMFRTSAHVECPNNSIDLIKSIAKEKGYVSPYSFHTGTLDILSRIK